ncbi:MAG: efflux RND transporter permease subunit [Candidatus Saccharicenans sp.]|uniref:efflux RND transporter permease subunit n=1 Tax=Candidatus Saccharicenans sp. TaxID=2819258 RepID=UPI00404968D7
MEKVWRKLLRFSWLIILFLIVLTVFFALQFKHLHYQNKFTSWLPQADPVVKLLLDTGEKFGSTELVLVTFKARQGETFRPDLLQSLKQATEELRQQKEVFYVTSIISAPSIQAEAGELIVSDFLEEIPESESELQVRLQEALAKENYVSTYLSADGRWLGAAVYLRSGVDSAEAFSRVVKAIMEKHLAGRAEIHYAGEPCFTYYADKYLKKDLKLLVPVIVLTVLLVLYLSFRKLRAVFLPSLVVWLSTVWVFGLMAIFRVPMNLVTPALPVLLIGLGSAYGIHMVNSIEQNRAEGLSRVEGLARGAGRVALPVFMAAATTMVGFVSFLTAKLGLIINFGIFAGVGVMLAMVITYALIPSALYLLPEPRQKAKERTISLVNPALFNWLAGRVVRYSRAIIVASLVICVFFILWIPTIKREVNFTSYFPSGSEPRQADRVVRANFDGAAPLSLYFKTDNLRSAGALRVLRRAENFMVSLPSCGLPLSAAELVEELNEKMNGRFSLPETDGQVANLWFFLEGRDELRQLISEDFREGLVFSRTSSARTEFHWKLRRAISAFLEKEMPAEFKEISLAGLPDEIYSELRKKEGKYLLDEAEWLLKRYAPQATFARQAAENALRELIDRWPQPSEPEVVSLWRQELESYVLADSFDFVLPLAERQTLIGKLVEVVQSGNGNEASFLELLKQAIPRRSYEEETARRVAVTFSLRLKEAREKVAVERAEAKIKWLLPAETRNNDHFQRRLRGLWFELADDLVVLPANRLEGRLTSSPEQTGQALKFELIDQSGLPPALTQLDHYLFVSQLQSFILALALTFIIMLLIRKSLKLGLISITPIVFTLGLVYGFFGLAGLELDYVTMMVASVSIGVGIDYSIHFVHGVMTGLRQGLGQREAVTQAFMEKGAAIVVNSLAVMLGFAVLLLASMSPLRIFGGIMVGSMFLAAFSALTILPALLLRVKMK